MRDFDFYNSGKNKEEARKLIEEFWEDAREDLGYGSLFETEAIQALENKAWEGGHAEGFQSVYQTLEELVELAKVLVKNAKVSGQF